MLLHIILILLIVGTSYVFSVYSDTSYAYSDDSCQQQHNIHLLPEICGNKSTNNNAIETIRHLISTGSLSKARKVAYECLYLIRGSDDNNVKMNSDDNNIDVRQCCSSEDKVIQTYKSSSDAFYNNENFLDLIEYEYQHQQQYGKIIDCWNGDELKKSNSISFGLMEEGREE